jgi:hypothetical protein
VGGTALSTLDLSGDPSRLLDEPAAVLLGTALRANTTLTAVSVTFMCLFSDAGAATALLQALTAHPSLQKLDLSFNYDEDFYHEPAALDAARVALGALVAANAPALRELDLFGCDLTDVGGAGAAGGCTASQHAPARAEPSRERRYRCIRARAAAAGRAREPVAGDHAGVMRHAGLRRTHEQHASRQLLA